IGVLYTLTDDGVSIRDGIEIEAKTLGVNANFIYSSFAAAETAALSTAIENFRSQGVAAVIVASNQAPFKAAIGVMETLDMEVPVFTSYVNADPTAVDPDTDYGFPIYTNAWVDVFSTSGQADVVDFATAINNASFLDQPTKEQMLVNSFAIAGYIAAKVFIQGLERVGDDTLTWESFIKAMESAPINIPMGGTVDFGGGKRHGIDAMSLLLFNTTTNTFDKVREIETIGQIRG
ncbi:MAG: ABC transporter substrate-binding protein, partial [Acholeplasmataceae bacterium]|nr:ABC transporter substrate-binding protein [Acholeplasmataceae bacterium]